MSPKRRASPTLSEMTWLNGLELTGRPVKLKEGHWSQIISEWIIFRRRPFQDGDCYLYFRRWIEFFVLNCSAGIYWPFYDPSSENVIKISFLLLIPHGLLALPKVLTNIICKYALLSVACFADIWYPEIGQDLDVVCLSSLLSNWSVFPSI